MGQALFESDQNFREAMFLAERIVLQSVGVSILDAVFSSSDDWMSDLRITHPAIFAFQWALAQSAQKSGWQPAVCLGSSLGEYVALAVAGSASFPSLLSFIVKQARNIIEHLPPGGMVTVLVTEDFFRQQPEIFACCALASVNFKGHIVISGASDALQRCCQRLDELGISAFWLPVPFAFHSPIVQGVRLSFFESARSLRLQGSAIPVVSSVQPVGELGVPDAEHLWRIVEQTCHFQAAVEHVESMLQSPVYLDCSPSGTMANFLRYILGPSARHRIRALCSPGRLPASETPT